MARRLMTIPGLGPVTASAMAASVQDASAFSGPREFAAFLTGLTPDKSRPAASRGWATSRRWAIDISGGGLRRRARQPDQEYRR